METYKDEKKLCYKFVGMPTYLSLRLDNNLKVMLFTLIQLSTWAEDEAKRHGQKWDGWFFRDNARLSAESRLSKNLVIATIETLYREKLIDVRCSGKAKGKSQKANYYKVFFDKFKTFETGNIEDLYSNEDLKIQTLDYKDKNFKVTYLNQESVAVCDTVYLDELSQSEHYIENKQNTENVKNKEKLENKNNKENNRRNNIL